MSTESWSSNRGWICDAISHHLLAYAQNNLDGFFFIILNYHDRGSNLCCIHTDDEEKLWLGLLKFSAYHGCLTNFVGKSAFSISHFDHGNQACYTTSSNVCVDHSFPHISQILEPWNLEGYLHQEISKTPYSHCCQNNLIPQACSQIFPNINRIFRSNCVSFDCADIGDGHHVGQGNMRWQSCNGN